MVTRRTRTRRTDTDRLLIMSEPSSTPPVDNQTPQTYGLLAEYSDPQELLAASRAVRDAGYTRWDTYTPFPVHGIDPAMNIRATRLPWIVFTAGLSGGIGALTLQWWTSTVDYPWLVSGKPLFSIPANIPITFELTVLAAALTCFFSMLLLNKLPQPSDPLDRVKRFARVTNDRFFVFVRAADPKFDAESTRALLAGTKALAVEEVPDDVSTPASVPRGLVYALLVLGSAAVVPFALIALARVSTSTSTRIHVVPDMDWQQKYKAQRMNPFFEDDRATRPQVEGTVASGELREDDHFYTGKVDDVFARTFPDEVSISDATMARGEERYGIYCTPCHGVDGAGSGMVARRAASLREGTWVPPTDLHTEVLHYKPVGELFNTISNGVRNMPAYARQISPADRWAIVLYVRALQRTRAAKAADLPADLRATLDKAP
jgi:mono/diheme cytochrome c family protein